MSLWFLNVELRESNQSHYSCMKIEHIKLKSLCWPCFLPHGLRSKESRFAPKDGNERDTQREAVSRDRSSVPHPSPAAIFPGARPHPCESATSHSATLKHWLLWLVRLSKAELLSSARDYFLPSLSIAHTQEIICCAKWMTGNFASEGGSESIVLGFK